jgi:hypothetical protein
MVIIMTKMYNTNIIDCSIILFKYLLLYLYVLYYNILSILCYVKLIFIFFKKILTISSLLYGITNYCQASPENLKFPC